MLTFNTSESGYGANTDVIGAEVQDYEQSFEQQKRLPLSAWDDKEWQNHLTGLKIKNPVHLLAMFDEHVRTGVIKLYEWQITLLKLFAEGKEPDKVLRIALCANNGAGKSQYIIAPCAIWLAMAFKQARAVVTSASGAQLDRQTGKALNRLCREINKQFGQVVWKCNYRFFTFLPTGSTIELYATDDAGKAEGYHPHIPFGELAVFPDEAKSIEDKIFQAIDRYRGTTRRFDVSSPGNPAGEFYNHFDSSFWYAFRVKYTDCPDHISQDEVDEAKEKYGESSAWFRSSYLAEFTSIKEEVILSWDTLQYCLKAQIRELGNDLHAGLDISLGGDESVLSIWKGNKQLHLICFRIEESNALVAHIKLLIDRYNIPCENINADDGGIGKPIIDMLWRDGYMVNRVRNESIAFDKSTFSNRGAELWWNFSRMVQERHVILLNDKTQNNQLSSRYYSRGDVHGKLILESKRIARGKGHGSPDRADATVLAFAHKRFPLEEFAEEEKSPTMQHARYGTGAIIDQFQKEKFAYSGMGKHSDPSSPDEQLDKYCHGQASQLFQNN